MTIFGLIREKLRSPLARRLIIAIIVVSSTITLCLSALQLYGEYRSELGSIQAVFRQIEEVHLKSLSQSLWATNEPELQLQIEGIVRVPNLEYIAVREGDTIWAQAGHRTSRKIIERQYPMTYVHRGETIDIGTLTVVAGLDAVYRGLVNRAFIILASNAFKTFLVAGFAFAFFHWLVNRHLLSIAAYLRGLDLRGHASSLILVRAARRQPDELDEVAAAINLMQENARSTLDALRANEERYRDLVENIRDLICTHDLAGNILFANRASAELLGYTPDELLKMNIRDIVAPAVRAEFEAYLAAIQCDGTASGLMRVRTKAGETRIWEYHNTLRADGAGAATVRGLARDVSERRRFEQINAQLAAIVEPSNDAIVSRGSDGAIITWNAAAERLFGYTAAEVIGQNVSLIIPADQEARRAQRLARLKDGLSVPTYDTVRLGKDGRRIDVAVTASPLKDASGKMMGISLVFRDISERKRAEVERAQLAAIVESSNDAILIRDPGRTILSWNAAAERLFGWSAQEAIGQAIDLIVPPERIGKLRGFIGRVTRGESVSPVETTHLRKDGARIPTQITVSPVRDKQGNVIAHSFTVRDMTELKRNEEALRSYAARLRELSRRLQAVEATERNAISRELHDRIGQGLTTLSLMVGTLGARLPKEARSTVQTQLKDIQALLGSVVANVRDVMAELRPPVLDDYGLLAALRHLVTEFAKRTGIAVNLSGVDLHPRLPLIVETAMFRISQETLNNIAKHAHAKKVEVKLNPVSERVVLDIADDGIGFDANNMPHGGEHWGMITMRERAEAVGITLRLESASGAGTRVVLEAERAAS